MNTTTLPSIDKNSIGGTAFAVVLIGVFAASQLGWIFSDQRVWPWDQAMYGTMTLRLWDALQQGPSAWYSAMVHAVGGNPPLLVWLGQFFVPIARLTGQYETALLLVNVLAAAGTLWLVYLTSRRLGAPPIHSAAAIVTCAGSQLFTYVSSQYLMEMLQGFSAAFMLFAAWHAEERSLARTLSLVLAAVSLAALSKASSVVFVLPMLTYVAASLVIARRRSKPPMRAGDVVISCVAIIAAGAATIWYVVNWPNIADHFRKATVDEGALYWGSPVHFPTKLKYWTETFATAVSPLQWMVGFIAFLIVFTLVLTAWRCVRKNIDPRSKLSSRSTVLFAATLFGTLALTLLTYSLQINEDPRFLIPTIPFFGVLTAWALATLCSRVLLALVFAALVVNALITGGYAHGANPSLILPRTAFLSRTLWPMLLVSRHESEEIALTQAVRLTCRSPAQRNFVVPQYAYLNVNSVNFYMEKKVFERGFRCTYDWFGSFPTDVRKAIEIIQTAAPEDIITAPLEKQPAPDAVNVVTRPVTDFLTRDVAYDSMSCCDDNIFIFHRRP